MISFGLGCGRGFVWYWLFIDRYKLWSMVRIDWLIG